MADSKQDSIYAEHMADVAGFCFDDTVADVFEDMIRRSVPGYGSTIAMTAILAKHYAKEGTNCYDLGSSLGAATISMMSAIESDNCKIVAVDNSEAMVQRCKENIARVKSPVNIDVLCEDIIDTDINQASVVVLNFTLQFIAPDKRKELIGRIHDNMVEGGVLILSEKIAFEDEEENQLMTDMHHDFKKAQGYSDLEISQKRSALENVLIPETITAHESRLNEAGFASSHVWFRCFNFASLIAHK